MRFGRPNFVRPSTSERLNRTQREEFMLQDCAACCAADCAADCAAGHLKLPQQVARWLSGLQLSLFLLPGCFPLFQARFSQERAEPAQGPEERENSCIILVRHSFSHVSFCGSFSAVSKRKFTDLWRSSMKSQIISEIHRRMTLEYPKISRFFSARLSTFTNFLPSFFLRKHKNVAD
jgi:hypothetical protein